MTSALETVKTQSRELLGELTSLVKEKDLMLPSPSDLPRLSLKIRTKISLWQERSRIHREWDPLFFEIFDGIENFKKIPFLKVNVDELDSKLAPNLPPYPRIFYYFKEEHFSAPLVRVTVELEDKRQWRLVLFRTKDNLTGRVFREAIAFYRSPSYARMDRDYTPKEQQKIIVATRAGVCDYDIERITRLIARKPIGYDMFISPACKYTTPPAEFSGGPFDKRTEGEKVTSDGKSVLELV